MSISGIYAIRNVGDSKLYIGSSNNLPVRWRAHRNELRRDCHRNKYLQNAWNKYGEVSFEFYVLERCDESALLAREDYYLAAHKTLDEKYGYNLVEAERHVVSQRARENIRKSARSRRKPPPFSAEHRKHIGDTWRGKSFSDEHKRKMSEAAKGKIMSDEACAHMSEAHKGEIHSPEHKRKISEIMKGKKLGEAHRKNTRAGILRWWADRKAKEAVA